MSAAAVTPRIRLMAICDGVRENKTEVGVFHLRGLRQHVVANGLPFAPSRLWLFLILSSPRPGAFPGYVRIVNDQTDKAVFFGNLTPSPTFVGDDTAAETRIRLRCTFPEEGRYAVQVWFFQEHGPDVQKGEVSLSVMREGG